jgi:AcrR family transcriptional regulator
MREIDGNESDPIHDARPVGRDEVVEATLRAATALFADHNPSQVSVRQIAAAAGVSHALVHRYLGSKDDIFHAALNRSRQEAADYWMHEHGITKTSGTFEADLPPGRYIRTIMRASLDGVILTSEDMKLPRAERMVDVFERQAFEADSSNAGFDARLLMSAVTAMTAGMAVAEEFCLAQSGTENEDRAHVHKEFNRLIVRMMSLAQRPGA